MAKKPFVPTDPVTAREISLHTADALREIAGAPSIADAENRLTAWLRYAEARGVAPQIREHVQKSTRERIMTLKALAKNAQISASQKTAQRTVGERDDD